MTPNPRPMILGIQRHHHFKKVLPTDMFDIEGDMPERTLLRLSQ